MSELISVAISGTVGKQVFSSSQQKVLKGVILDAGSASGASFVIRDGNASGTIRMSGKLPANNANSFPILCEKGVRFDKGMHVKLLGTGGALYLEIN